MAGRAAKEVLEFEEHDLSSLIAALGSLREHDGWVNVTPGVPAELVEEQHGIFAWLAGSATQTAPLATWMPLAGSHGASGKLGVLHARGRLHREGIAGLVSIPPSWRCTQDHARRGLIFEVTDASPEAMAEVLVAVVDELTTVPTTGRYLAEVFRR